MIPVHLHAADPLHGRRLPTGRSIAVAVRQFFARQLVEIKPRLAQRKPVNLDRWTRPMVEALTPIVQPILARGGHEAARRIRRLYAEQAGDLRRTRRPDGHRQRGVAGEIRDSALGADALQARGALAPWYAGPCYHAGVERGGGRRKAGAAPGDPGQPFAFDLFNPRVLDFLARLVFDFCDETNRTSSLRVQQAYAALRQELARGLEEGEAQARLNRRVLEIFADPFRAARIGQTEGSRALHGGQWIAAKESGVVEKKRWLASSDACDQCQKLNGLEVDLDEPFVVLPGRGVYSRVMFAPLHPHCMCTWVEVL